MATRLAFARLFQETNALSPVATDEASFARFLAEGDALLRRCTIWGAEVPGIWRNAELTGFCVNARRHASDVELVPLFSTLAIPGGKVTREVYDRYESKLLEGLVSAGPLFGVYLALHGAMGVVGLDDAEGHLLEAVRRVIGDLPLVVSFDMHGFLTPRRIAATDLMLAYRTYPHRDQFAIGAAAARLLIGISRRQIRPVQAWRTLPMILGGSPNVDFLEPMRPIFRHLRALHRRPGVLAASVLCCQPWHDAPSLGWCAHVVTDRDLALAEALVDDLAERMWAVRDHLPGEVSGPGEAIDRIRSATFRRRIGTACLADASDAVGAGGVGENTALVEALLRDGRGLKAYAPIRDAAAVERLWREPNGAVVDVELGGRLAPRWYSPLGVRGTVVDRREDTLLGGRTVVLRCGDLTIAVTSDPPIAIGPGFYSDLGLSPWRADLCVVKSWVAFRFYYLPHNRLSVWARTRGVTDLDAMREIPYDVPVHPFTAVKDWREADRLRRGPSR